MWQIQFDPIDKKWSNAATPHLYHESASIGYVAITELEKFADRVIQISDNNGVTITAKEMRSKIIRSAIHLERLQLDQGDVIGVVARNNHNLAPIIMGALLNGYTINAVDITFSQDEIEHMFNITKPKIILCDSDQYDKLHTVINAINLHSAIITLDKELNGCEYADDYFHEVSNEMCYVPVALKDGLHQIAFITCSSGTTGYHKAICLSHAQFIKKTLGFAKLGPDFKLYCPSSLYWLAGIDNMLISILTCLPRIISTDSFSVENFYRLIQKYRIKHILIPPSYLAQVIKSPELKTANLASVQILCVSGAAVPISHYEEIQKYLPNGLVFPAYGVTELCGVCTINIIPGKFSSVGLVYRDMEARIIDEAGNCLGPTESGEIVLRDIHFTFLGYKNDAEATKSVFYKDGWIRTGDIGYFDDRALLYVTGRKTDIIKYQSYNISPTELEEIILNFGSIKGACVVGVSDSSDSDLLAALIVKDLNFREVEFLNYIDGKLSDYKSLRGGIYYVDSIPHTANGKLKRREAKEIAVKLFRTK